MLIKLRDQNTREIVLVNPDHIVHATAFRHGSAIALVDKTGLQVTETPDEILGMVPAYVTYPAAGCFTASEAATEQVRSGKRMEWRRARMDEAAEILQAAYDRDETQTRAGEGRPKEPR